jgi:hypothetical protein
VVIRVSTEIEPGRVEFSPALTSSLRLLMNRPSPYVAGWPFLGLGLGDLDDVLRVVDGQRAVLEFDPTDNVARRGLAGGDPDEHVQVEPGMQGD